MVKKQGSQLRGEGLQLLPVLRRQLFKQGMGMGTGCNLPLCRRHAGRQTSNAL